MDLLFGDLQDGLYVERVPCLQSKFVLVTGDRSVHVVHRHADEVSDVLTTTPGLPFLEESVLLVDFAGCIFQLADGHPRLHRRNDGFAGFEHAGVHLFLLGSELAGDRPGTRPQGDRRLRRRHRPQRHRRDRPNRGRAAHGSGRGGHGGPAHRRRPRRSRGPARVQAADHPRHPRTAASPQTALALHRRRRWSARRVVECDCDGIRGAVRSLVRADTAARRSRVGVQGGSALVACVARLRRPRALFSPNPARRQRNLCHADRLRASGYTSGGRCSWWA